MSTSLLFPDDFSECAGPKEITLTAAGFPAASHPAEADLFDRQRRMPGHDQTRIEKSTIGIVGAGGLCSWIGLGCARMGVRRLTVFDGDRFDRTNAPRQLMHVEDLGKPKAHALARNLLPHMTNGGVVRALAKEWSDALLQDLSNVDLLIVGVDNNRTRLMASRWGLSTRKPVVFAMLSQDGLRAQIFLQRSESACLSCVLPNLDPAAALPCAAASIASCFLAAAHVLELSVATLSNAAIPGWRETSLDGTTERALDPPRRNGCHCRPGWSAHRTAAIGSPVEVPWC